MSTHNMFLLRNKKDISIFLDEKSTLSAAMQLKFIDTSLSSS